MIKIEHTDVYGFEAAIRGMRSPMNSWDKSDSGEGCLSRLGWRKAENEEYPLLCKNCAATYESHCVCRGKRQFVIGENDLRLMQSLVKAGSDHSKFMRMMNVTVDITAPLYWWKEFDTYKVGTVANSCSTMHKIHSKEFTLDDFSTEHLCKSNIEVLEELVLELEYWRDKFVNYDEYCEVVPEFRERYSKKNCWWQLIQLLPSSYNQKRTVQLNYQVLKSMYFARRQHRLDEWHTLCEWMEELPFFKEICIDVE